MKAFVSTVVIALLAANVASAAKRPVFVYINTAFKSWSDPCLDIKHMIDQGATEVLIAFWLNTGNADAAIAWEWMSKTQREECLAYAHERGAKILLAAAGATDSPYTLTTGEDYGTRAAKATLDLGLDGLDFDLELLPPGFGDTFYYQWLVDCTNAARKYFQDNSTTYKIITHAPQGPYFTSWAGSNKGYVQLAKDLGDVVDYYLIQYYNQASCKYKTYESVFKSSENGCWSPGAAILEIKSALGASHEHLWTKMVVGKPATTADVMNTGFVAPNDLATMTCEAEKNDGYTAGVMVWSYRGMEHVGMNTFFDAVPGEQCGSSLPTVAPSTTTKAPTAPITPAPTTKAPTAPITPAPTTKAPTAPITPVPTTPPAAPTTLPMTSDSGTKKCFHNDTDVWWAADCTDEHLCVEDSSITSESDCTSSTFPYSVWVGDVHDCRNTILNSGGCTTLPHQGPTLPPPTGDEEACFHNEQGTWWVTDCSSPKLCVYDGALRSEAECLTGTSYPHPYFGTETGCREYVRMQGGCSA